MKILVVHHVRRLDNSHIYLSDDFESANNEVYGAQELDTWAGIRIFACEHEVWRLEICPNESMVRLANPLGVVVAAQSVSFAAGLKSFKDRFYLKSLLKYGDSSIAFFSRSPLIKFTSDIFASFEFDLLWWETQFYDSIIPDGPPSIVRSVNFEPVHVLAEDPSLFKIVRFLSKRRSERIISQKRQVVAISPADSENYRCLGADDSVVLPLRQLAFISEHDFISEDFSSSFLFFGSNFDVHHNRLNLEFIVQKLAPLMLKRGIKTRICVFGHRLPSDLELPPNIRYFGFAENLQGKQQGSLGVIVPYHGGAGMQSKIFEPLTLGVPIIANPRNFAGYDFKPFEDFFPATTVDEYLDGVLFFINNKLTAAEMGNRSKIICKELFSRSQIEKILENIISNRRIYLA